MTHHVIPTVEKHPESIVLHCGTNDLISDKSADEISNEIIELVRNIQTEENKIYVSAIIPRNDDLNDKGSKTNDLLRKKCNEINIGYIPHDNIDPKKHLNASKIHLNIQGSKILASNFLHFFHDL